MERVAIIIPNWNGKRFLQACLESLRHQTFKDFVTYMVDNGSVDDSVSYVEANFPEVAIVRHTDNLGFSAAINAGIRASSGEYIAALNNDTEVDADWLQELVNTLDANPKVGLCASKILDFSDRSVIDSFGDGYCRHGVAFKIGSLAEDKGQFEAPMEVLSPCAAASIYRRSMLNDIGMFDEDFFCYMEDIDLGIRALLGGYKCLVVPTAKVFHIGSASTGGGLSEFSLRMTAKNFPLVLFKNIPASLLWKILPRVIAGQMVIVFQTIIGQRPEIRKNFGSYWCGLGLSVRHFPAMMKKRREIQTNRRISPSDFYRSIMQSELQKRTYRA